MTGHRELRAALLAVASFSAAAPARAEEPARVVVVGASEQEPIVARVEQELRALGFVVTFASTTEADSASIARASRASAVLRVATQPLEIRVWIAARKRDSAATGEEESPRDFKIDAPGDKSDPAVVALGAVELLHGALLPIDARPRPPAPPISTPLTVARPAADATPRRDDQRGPFSVQLGGGVSIAAGGVSAAPVVLAGGSWRPGHGVELALFALLPTSPGSVAASDGTIHVHVGGGGADIGAALVEVDRRFDLHASLGAGLLVTAVDGTPRPGSGSAASSASSSSFFPHARVAGAVRVVPWLSARADVLAGLLTPEPIVESLDRAVARVGQPELAFVASLEARP